MSHDYQVILLKDSEDLPKRSITGIASSLLANRVSWFFNLLGPSVNLDSACSSSLVALDIACQALRSGETSMVSQILKDRRHHYADSYGQALVGGANTVLAAELQILLNNLGFLSPDSRCYSFDDRANGYARGEGCGVLVIKRASDAIRDGDAIRAIIRSTGSNQDGHTPGVTQPNGDSQAALIQDTYEKAGLDFDSTRFFEAHGMFAPRVLLPGIAKPVNNKGTGTAIGDPVEANAIGSVFRKHRSAEEPLLV